MGSWTAWVVRGGVGAFASVVAMAACAPEAREASGAAEGGGGAGALAGSGAGGKETLCTPGEMVPCYSGPAGTEGVGICHGGSRTCNAEGTALGACEGEVTPGAEQCGDLEDNDCNGAANEACVYASCAEVPAGSPNGMYTIERAGEQFNVECDMTTDGGGWTLVFSQKDESRWTTGQLAYYTWSHPGIQEVIQGSSHIMAYFASGSNTAVAQGFEKFKFPTPRQFDTLWTNPNTPETYLIPNAVNVSNGNAPENVEGSRYSTISFASYLAQSDGGGWWGRFGINTTRHTGFFFSGWTVVKQDPGNAGRHTDCVHNDQPHSETVCSASRYLVIWAR